MTSDGSILTASADENIDLFFSIRGGGGNFGVVTQFVFKLMLQRRTVYSGEVIFPVSRMEEVVHRTNTWWESALGKEGLFVAFITDPEGNVRFSFHLNLDLSTLITHLSSSSSQ